MAKVKRSPKKLAATTKANTTTPSKTINGGVQKVRVMMRKVNFQTKLNDNLNKSVNSKVTTNLQSPKSRLCLVKLRRFHSNNKNSSNIDHTLQDQCKANENDVIENKSSKEKNFTDIVDTKETVSTKSSEKDDNSNKENLIISTKKSNKNVNKTVPKVTKTSARKYPAEVVGFAKASTPTKMDTNTNDVCATPKNNKISQRRCLVKIKRTRTPQSKINNTKEQSQDTSTKKSCKNVQKAVTFMTPKNNKTRHCAVVIKRTPHVQANIKKKAPQASIAKTPNTPKSIRKCLVKVQRTPVTKNRIRNDTKNAHKDTIDLTSPTNITVIDEVTRNNFRKLSLNPSPSKLKSTELNKNKDEQEKTTKILKPIEDNIEKIIVSETTKVTQSEISKHTNKNNSFTKFKHVQKLSLKKQITQPNNNLATNVKFIQFEPQQNSTICFEPPRNSTLLDFGFAKDKNNEKQMEINNNEEQKKEKTMSPKNKSSSQNLANKSQEIENLLNSLDDDQGDEITNCSNAKGDVNSATNIQISANKTNKFFHRTENNSPKIILNQVINVSEKIPSPKTNRVTRKRGRFLTKRSDAPKRSNVYEFLSQSQTSDSDSNKHLDPAADIIKRLIAQGRVRVATNCKGKGRPVLKRKAHNKQVKKQPAAKKGKQLKNKKNKVPDEKVTEQHNANENEDVIEFDDHFEDNFYEPFPEIEQPQNPSFKNITNNHQHYISDQEGTFSRLAKSVLINQAGRSDLQRKKAQRLLEMAKKFVSTPKNKKNSLTQTALHSDLSPIAMLPPRPPTIPSPWRVDEDAHLPRVFNFSRSSGNLPSFSSDFIPSTPRKAENKNKMLQHSNQQTQNILSIVNNQNTITSIPPQSPLPNINENDNTYAHPPSPRIEKSVLSSFSSNDSNAENMPPPKATVRETNNVNDNIFDLKQLPNPRRTLNYRSPLKAINILEVVHLPPYKHPNKTTHSKEIEKELPEMFGFEENLNDESCTNEKNISATTTPQKSRKKKSKNPAAQDLFGFEEFLTQTDSSSQESNNIDETEQNKTIHDKLRDLRKLKPDDAELQLNLSKAEPRRPLQTINLFNDDATSDAKTTDGLKQRDIKEMLCSTMIEKHPQPSTSKEALKQLKKRNLRGNLKPNFGEGSNLSELFKDPEPETTFNESEAHRTYIRPYKRKRRLREDRLVIYLESDESDNEQDSMEHRKHHHSHETDTSSENAPKKKRKRKDPKDSAELTEFIHDFNEMCQEVDSYELVVEKSA